MDWSSASVRVFLGVLVAYPLMAIYRKFVRTMPLKWHHLYFSVTGISVSYFAFGTDGPLHGIVACLINWVVLRGLGTTKLSTALIFVLQLGYLCAGYVAAYTKWQPNIAYLVSL